jgi:hypothetical protein
MSGEVVLFLIGTFFTGCLAGALAMAVTVVGFRER